MVKHDGKRKILFILFIVCVSMLAVVYFSVPNRKEFHRNQLGWWGEMWQVMTEHASDDRR
jgi:cytochrome c oxidase assembly protein Cox11